MKKQKHIIILLIFSICLNIGHDFLPYHSHGSSHYFDNKTEKSHTCCDVGSKQVSVEHESHNHVDDCDGDHQQCTVCFHKHKNPYNITNHYNLEYFPVISFIIEGNEESIINDNLIFSKSEQFLVLKTLLYRSPCPLRGPPALV